ncbi:MAG TPA: GNAT family N-acetyltransferase [Nocardioides sp.]|nr:GNAT family N-acetyltransferase [Nocardioides sp.]
MTEAHDGSQTTDPADTERATLLAAYDAQLRGVAEVQGSVSWDQSGPLWRALSGRGGFVSYESLESAGSLEAVDSLIGETVAFYAGHPDVEEFEWKTRGHDWPPELDRLLRAHALERGEVETVMVGEATHLVVDVELPEGVSVRRVDQLRDRAALVSEASEVAKRIFGEGPSGEEMLDRLDRMQGREQFWVAEAKTDDGSRVVCSGRLALVEGTEFAGIWGGSTLPEWRGKGIYRALTAARARAALAEGVRYIHSDCTVMSRPILERSGLVAVTTSTPYLWRR